VDVLSVQLARIKRLFQRLEQEYEGLAAAVKVQKIILTIVFVAHFVACFWYMVGTEIEIQIGETTVTTHADHPPGTPLYEIFGAGDSISNPDAYVYQQSACRHVACELWTVFDRVLALLGYRKDG